MPAASSSRVIMTTLSSASGPGLRASFMSQTSPPTVPSAPRRTKLSNPLRLDKPIRRGLRGGLAGGGAGSFSLGFVARPNRLTRGRGASPSPESGSPLMSLAAFSPSAADAAVQILREAAPPDAALGLSLADRAPQGNTQSS